MTFDFPDGEDNCLDVSNPGQRDTNLDGFGNACDADLNNDGAVDFLDLGLLKAVFFTDDADADLNGDGSVDFLDLGLMKSRFFQPPGPSGLDCAGTIPCTSRGLGFELVVLLPPLMWLHQRRRRMNA